MADSLKIIFAGTPDFAACHLDKLITSQHQVIGVFTQPDRPAGRGNKLTASPVKNLALQYQLPLFQPASLRTVENQQLITKLNADIMVVVAYGLILPQAVLTTPRLGCINVHGSLLPRWRGAAPIQRSLWAGDTETGITIIQMDAGLDTGDMLYKLSTPISNDDTSVSLYQKLAELGPQGMLEALRLLAKGQAIPAKQDESQVTRAKKLNKEEAYLDWSLSAIQLERCIRAFNPWPVSYFMINNQKIKVWKASVMPHQVRQPGEIVAADTQGIQIATIDGVLKIEMLQPEGKKIMTARDLLNSRHKWFTPGTILA